jgi:hypothetical protein
VIEREFGVPTAANARVFHDVQRVIGDEGTVKAVVIVQKPTPITSKRMSACAFNSATGCPELFPKTT